MFHAKEGWFFERREDGGVYIACRDLPKYGGKLITNVLLDADCWSSVVSSVSLNVENYESFIAAKIFHMKRIRDNGNYVCKSCKVICVWYSKLLKCDLCGQELEWLSKRECDALEEKWEQKGVPC